MNNIFTLGTRSARKYAATSMVVALGILLQLLGSVFFAPSFVFAQDASTVALTPEAQSFVSSEILSPEPSVNSGSGSETLDVLASVFVETQAEAEVSTDTQINVSAVSSFSSEQGTNQVNNPPLGENFEQVVLKDLPVPANACVPGDDTGGISLSDGEMVWHFVLTNSKTEYMATLHVSFDGGLLVVSPTTTNDGVQHFYIKTASGVTITGAFVTDAVAKYGKNMALHLSHCAFGPGLPPPPALATIIATKIVCESESDLPNWGTGGPDITANTAAQFLSTHPNCRLESGWKFQSAPAGTLNPGDALVGEASAPWITSPATDVTGKTTWTVPAQGERVWVREALKDGYIPFTFLANGETNVDPVSAEMYCDTDVLNYDNYDAILSPRGNTTYQCIAFNAPKTMSDPSACPFTANEGTYVIEYGTTKKIVSNSTHSAANVTKAVSIPAGTYEVSLYSYDSYPTRMSVTQPREEWYCGDGDSE